MMFKLDEAKRVVPCADDESMPEIEDRRVGHRLGKHAEVSTVFLCIEHQWGMFFETAYKRCWSSTQTLEDVEWVIAERYQTWDEAVKGHGRWVAVLFGATVDEIVAAFGKGEGLEIRCIGMAKDNAGGCTSAAALDVVVEHFDIIIQWQNTQGLRDPLWERGELSRDDAQVFLTMLETRLPEACAGVE